jgi:hypothetical protein
MDWLNNPESMWVVMVHPTQLRGNLKRLIQKAKRVVCISKGETVCLKKGWWTTGELSSGRMYEHPSFHIPPDNAWISTSLR